MEYRTRLAILYFFPFGAYTLFFAFCPGEQCNALCKTAFCYGITFSPRKDQNINYYSLLPTF